EPEPTVPENWAHRASPRPFVVAGAGSVASPWSGVCSGPGSTYAPGSGRASRVTSPVMLVTLRFAEPEPMVALMTAGPGPEDRLIPSKPLCTRPDVDFRSTRALAQAGRPTATSPETAETRPPPPPPRPLSAVPRPPP